MLRGGKCGRTKLQVSSSGNTSDGSRESTQSALKIVKMSLFPPLCFSFLPSSQVPPFLPSSPGAFRLQISLLSAVRPPAPLSPHPQFLSSHLSLHLLVSILC